MKVYNMKGYSHPWHAQQSASKFYECKEDLQRSTKEIRQAMRLMENNKSVGQDVYGHLSVAHNIVSGYLHKMTLLDKRFIDKLYEEGAISENDYNKLAGQHESECEARKQEHIQEFAENRSENKVG